MAICITHTNKTDQVFTLQVIIKDGKKDVETVNLAPNQEVWTEAHTMTSSLRVYQRKGLITMKEDRAKKGIEFLVPYTIGEKKARNPQPALPTTPPKPAPKPKPEPKKVEPKPKTIEQAMDEVAERQLKGEKENPMDILADSRKNLTDDQTSVSSILDKASKQVEEYTKPELKTGKWEDEEITYLRRYYPAKGAKFVADKLNRGEKSVAKKAEALKIKRKRK
ncbi:MAG: hypothetical protein P8J32_08275 [bacterium]|nr:hypothetical protein [bacterium]